MSQAANSGAQARTPKLEDVLRRASADHLLLTDVNGTLLDCNDRFAGEFGSGGDSPIGKGLSVWLSSEELSFAQKRWQRLFSGSKAERGLRKMKNGSGQVRLLDFCETPVISGGQPVAILSVGRDITEEALLEDKLWETQETRDSAVEYAVRASLGLIKGYIYSMRGGDSLSESQRAKFGRVVMDEIEALSRTIENLLSARGLHDDSITPAELCDVKSLMSAAIVSVEAEAQRREIKICRDEPVDSVEMHVPEAALVRLFQNLLEHCVMRITHSGQIHVKLQDSGEYIDIQISDNGSSVSEDLLRTLFVLRPPSARSEETALGSRSALYVARLFAEAMGGAVSVRSSAAGGLEFHLMLPRQAAGFTSAQSGHDYEGAQTSAMSVQ